MKKFFFLNLLDHKEKIVFFPLCLIILFSSILEILSIGLLIPFFDLILKNNSYFYNNLLQGYIDKFSYNNLVFYSTIIIFFLFTFKTIFLIFSSFFQLKFIKNINANISKKLLAIYLNKSFIFYLKNNTSFLIQNINEVNSITLHIRSQLIFLSEVIIFIGIMTLLFYNSLWITLITLLIFSLFSYFIKIFIFKKTKIIGQERLIVSQKRLRDLHEGFDGIRDIKIFGLEKYFLLKFLINNDVYNTYEFKNAFNLSLPRFLLEWLLIFLSLLLVFFVFYFSNFIDLEKSISLLALFCVSILRLIPSLLRIIQSRQQIKFTTPAVKKIFEEFDDKIKIDNSNLVVGKIKKIDFTKNLIIENLNFGYGDLKKKVINNLNTHIDFGNFLGISGVSGSGKTTLLSIILGLLKPDKGNIIVDGINVFNDIRAWQAVIGYVPQNLYLIDNTIQNNIALGTLKEDLNLNLLNKVINLACLDDLINELPMGMQTNIGEKGINLSGGQRQRIGIARALYRQPKLLILDEFTNALDKKLEEKILNNIYGLKKNVTGIIVSHDNNVLKNCDKIIYLN
jgi:ABC-type bacteriocin/lantibiotic exporter with double-glycine peptidase domain